MFSPDCIYKHEKIVGFSLIFTLSTGRLVTCWWQRPQAPHLPQCHTQEREFLLLLTLLSWRKNLPTLPSLRHPSPYQALVPISEPTAKETGLMWWASPSGSQSVGLGWQHHCLSGTCEKCECSGSIRPEPESAPGQCALEPVCFPGTSSGGRKDWRRRRALGRRPFCSVWCRHSQTSGFKGPEHLTIKVGLECLLSLPSKGIKNIADYCNLHLCNKKENTSNRIWKQSKEQSLK